MPSIKENLEQVKERIEKTLLRSGRRDEVALVAVTKTVPLERIIESIRAGVSIIGENRVGEADEKHALIREKVSWHLVGHLQRNKVKKAIPIFDMIQSIDKMETAREIEKEIEKRAARPVDVLIEINSSGEETKSGIEPERLFFLIDQLRTLGSLSIKGVMTVGPLTPDQTLIRRAFQVTKRCFEELKSREKGLDIRYLSMGMSADFELAIEEGSNMVRIGSAIFGPRA